MIHCLDGMVLSKTTGSLVISCGGVGFFVSFPISAYADLPDVGESGTVYTHFSVKEDGMELFGFASEQQLAAFRKLISVSGVGPRVGMSILSVYDSEAIAIIIASGDFKALTNCPGVGQKLAQRILLELKDKVGDFGTTEAANLSAVSAATQGAAGEAVAALVSLGFSQSEAAAAVSRQPSGASVEEIIAAALRAFGTR